MAKDNTCIWVIIIAIVLLGIWFLFSNPIQRENMISGGKICCKAPHVFPERYRTTTYDECKRLGGSGSFPHACKYDMTKSTAGKKCCAVKLSDKHCTLRWANECTAPNSYFGSFEIRRDQCEDVPVDVSIDEMQKFVRMPCKMFR